MSEFYYVEFSRGEINGRRWIVASFQKVGFFGESFKNLATLIFIEHYDGSLF
jgi:hypothetical protein